MFKRLKDFRDKHSTQHVILDILNTIQSNMDKLLFTCGILMDLKKAFDTVDHSILLNKLYHYGIRGIINDWFSFYLSGRKYCSKFMDIQKTNSPIWSFPGLCIRPSTVLNIRKRYFQFL